MCNKTNYRKASEKDSTADFVMQYGAANGMLRRPRILDVLTTRPPQDFINGRNVRTTRHMPKTLTSNSCVMLDVLNHSSGPITPGTPTLLTMPHSATCHIHIAHCTDTAMQFAYNEYTLWFKKNAPTLADYNYNPVQSILIIFSKPFVNDHKSCLVVKFSTSPHICCHYTL